MVDNTIMLLPMDVEPSISIESKRDNDNRYQQLIETKLSMLSVARKHGSTCRSTSYSQLDLMHSLGYMYLNEQITDQAGFLIHENTIFIGYPLDNDFIELDRRLFDSNFNVSTEDIQIVLDNLRTTVRERQVPHQAEIELAILKIFPGVTI